ncbi:MAG: aminoglycoside phosphotransferase family protein [Pirellulaceae bacterium]|jgi:hypothetical protein|nr:aminoglycoside phosphotransferase family protein [Pirellulaceae bacterium]
MNRVDSSCLRQPPATLDLLAGLGLQDPGFYRATGGRNNRVYCAVVGERRVAVKEYFHHPSDSRDRLESEYSFCRFADAIGLSAAPTPLARDSDNYVGVYEWVAGRKLAGQKIGADHVRQAAQFVADLNEPRHRPHANNLPAASEACFSIRSHWERVARRVARLTAFEPPSSAGVHHDMRRWVATALEPVILRFEEDTRPEDDAEIPGDERLISPSDFGFHNCLERDDSTLAFLDFEYAGWDDPAKMVCDFFCQIEEPVSRDYMDELLTISCRHTADVDALRARVKRLLPLYVAKWCCIALNEFLPPGAARRQFGAARTGAIEEHELKRQLAIAQQLLTGES